MDIVCLDMEGTLTPEIWEQVSRDYGISELSKTTREIASYSDLMNFRIKIMKENNLKLSDIVSSTKKLNLLDGALDFFNQVRCEFQVVILSDTFHEIAYPLMEKLGYPLLLCHTLDVDSKDNIIGYNLRNLNAKKQAILSFQSIGYRCIAAGDSFNDLQMFEVADQGFFINAPKAISSSVPEIPSYNNYSDLLSALKNCK